MFHSNSLSENKFLLKLIEKSEDVFWIISLDHKKQIYISPMFEKIWGITITALYEDPEIWYKSVVNEDREKVENYLEKIKHLVEKKDKQFELTYRIQRADGEIRWIKDSCFISLDNSGMANAFCGVSRDITTDILKETELRYAARFFEQFAEKSESVFWVRDPKSNKQLYLSPAYEKVWGRSRESLYENPRLWIETVLEEDRDNNTAKKRSYVLEVEGKEAKYESFYRIKRPNGEIRWIKDNSFPIFDGNVCIGFAGIAEDITADKTHEQELIKQKENAEAANEAKVEFLQNMRHDIRTPLTGIMGFANIIKDRVTDPDIKKDVDILIESSESLLNLLNEILELIKVTSGKMPLYKKKFNLESKLIEVIKINHAKAASKGLDLSICYDKTIPAELLGDPDRIHRIVLELITNAIKFTQIGSVILSTNLIKETEQSVIVKITVEDTGIGMTEDQQQDIFIQFKRLNPSYQGIYKGTGLGLTLVRQLMEEIEGEIEIESNPSQGTAFTCIIAFKKTLWGTTEICTNIREIPINEKSPTPQQEQISRIKVKKERPTPYRILVVEDQSIAALFLKNMLTGLNCEVDVAPTGNMGKELAKNNSYDLIFMDIGLPDIDGLEVTRGIRADKLSKSQGVPIIAVTAHEDEKNAEHCLKAGMNEVYIKPLSREQAKLLFNKYIDSLAER